jgi:hypothetical protein
LLAAELLRSALEVQLPRDVAAAVGSADMSDVTPAVYLADMVVVVSDAATGEPVLAVVVEPQGRDDETKQISWPVYVTTARKSNKCPAAVLLVICWDTTEAAKCRRVISTGHPGFDLAPVVIDPFTAPGPSASSPYLTIFAACIGAISLETEAECHQVLTAIRDAGSGVASTRSLSTLIMGTASEAARQILEALMATSQYKSDFIEGFAEQGLEQGLVQGRKQGLALAKAESIAKILNSRGLRPDDRQRERLGACTDLDLLDRWFDRALAAASVDEVFAD